MKSVLTYLLFATIVVYLIICIGFYLFQEQFIFHPRKTALDFQYHFDAEFEEHFFETANNGNIHGLHFKAENSKGVVLYLHGNSGCLEDWGWLYKDFLPRGYDLMLIDFRKYGKSTGELSEKNIHNDVQEVYDYLKGHFSEENIVVYGRSIGSGMATRVASHNSPKALVLETPYFNLNDIVKRVVAIFPTNILLRYRFKSNEYVQEVDCPIYIIHGTKDTVVPYRSGDKLAKSIQGDQCKLVTIEGGTHNNLSAYDAYYQLLDEVLEK